MKRLVGRLNLFMLICLVLLATLILSTNKFIDGGDYYKLKKNASYLIVGHSHSACAYNDSLIENTVNYSHHGECFFYTFFKLKKVLEHNPEIKTVFVEFANNQINRRMDDWIWGDRFFSENYPNYAPFMKAEDFRVFWHRNPQKLFYLQNMSLRSNLSFLTHKKGNYFDDKDAAGYLYISRNETDSLVAALAVDSLKQEHDLGVSETNLQYLDKIVDLCGNDSVRLFFIRTPMHPASLEYVNEELLLKILHSRYGKVEFLDFRNFPVENEELGDLEHLNYKGARRFSLFFNSLLKDGLLQKQDKQQYIEETVYRIKTATIKSKNL